MSLLLRRQLAVSWVGLTLLMLPVVAQADNQPGDAPHDAGHVRGLVEDVDYHRGSLVLRTDRGRYLDIQVMPSTNISANGPDGDQYHGFTDIHVGEHIEADLSRSHHKLFAETIQIDGP